MPEWKMPSMMNCDKMHPLQFESVSNRIRKSMMKVTLLHWKSNAHKGSKRTLEYKQLSKINNSEINELHSSHILGKFKRKRGKWFIRTQRLSKIMRFIRNQTATIDVKYNRRQRLAICANCTRDTRNRSRKEQNSQALDRWEGIFTKLSQSRSTFKRTKSIPDQWLDPTLAVDWLIDNFATSHTLMWLRNSRSRDKTLWGAAWQRSHHSRSHFFWRPPQNKVHGLPDLDAIDRSIIYILSESFGDISLCLNILLSTQWSHAMACPSLQLSHFTPLQGRIICMIRVP
jgi:hypothetical protein